MGGQGSGRNWRYATRTTTDDHKALDVRKLQRDGVLRPGYTCRWSWMINNIEVASIGLRSTSESIVLSYQSKTGKKWQDMKYPVTLEWTACQYGGQRAWFRCPVVGCGRRVAILYSGRVFACRHCYHLVYASQRENNTDRTIRRADNIRRKLGWKPGILNPSGWKPKGMRWHTFEKLRTEHDTLVQISLNALVRKFRLFDR